MYRFSYLETSKEVKEQLILSALLVFHLVASPSLTYLPLEEESGYNSEDDFSKDTRWGMTGPLTETIGISSGAFDGSGQHGFIGAYEGAVTPANSQVQAEAGFSFDTAPNTSLELSVDLVFKLPPTVSGHFYTLNLQRPDQTTLCYLAFFAFDQSIRFATGATSPEISGFTFPTESDVTILLTVDPIARTWKANANGTLIVPAQSFPAGTELTVGRLQLTWNDAFTGSQGVTDTYLAFDNLYFRSQPKEPQLFGVSETLRAESLAEEGPLPVFLLEGPLNQSAVLETSVNLSDWNPVKEITFTKGFSRFQSEKTTGDPQPNFFRLRKLQE